MTKSTKPKGRKACTRSDAVSVTRPYRTYSQRDFSTRVGQWAEFTTPLGTHRGIIERVNGDGVQVRIPFESLAKHFVNSVQSGHSDFQLIGFFDGFSGFDGGYDGFHGCHPHRKPFCFPKWFWCWIPFCCFCW